MQIESQFDIAASPDRVYAFLTDVNRVVACVPGAELSEVVDPDTFNGKVKVKVGPITVGYSGTARITERDPATHLAKLEAEGRETTGPGSARATATMTVEPQGEGSLVKLATEMNVAGRVANFGRGVMEDVSRRLIDQMAECIKAHLEAVAEPPGAAAGATPAEPGGADPGGPAGPAPARPVSAAAPAKPVNALSLMLGIFMDRLRRLFGGS